MAAVIETGLPDLLFTLGTEFDDQVLSESADGRIKQTRANRLFTVAARDLFVRLRRDKMNPERLDPYNFTLSAQPNDSARYLLPTRGRQVFIVKDGEYQLESLDYHEKEDTVGYIINGPTIEILNYSVSGDVTAEVLLNPIELSYGKAAAGTGSTAVVLAQSPLIGRTSLEPNYYVGAYIGFEEGDARGEIRRITSQAIAAGVVTLTVSAWTSTPTTDDKYTFLLDLPNCMKQSVVLRAATKLARFDEVLSSDSGRDGMSLMHAEAERAYADARAELRGAIVGHLAQPERNRYR